jgi:hypothetical protein
MRLRVGRWRVCRIDGFHSSAVAFRSVSIGTLLHLTIRIVEPTVSWKDGPQAAVFDPMLAAVLFGDDGMDQGHTFENLAASSLRAEMPVLRARSLPDLAIALVALLVALVHHRVSYSVILGSGTDTLRWPRQPRGSLGRVTERD